MVIEPRLGVVVLWCGGEVEAVAGDGPEHQIDHASSPSDREVEALDAGVSLEEGAGVDQARLHVAVQLVTRGAALDLDDASGEVPVLHPEVAGEIIDRSDQVGVEGAGKSVEMIQQGNGMAVEEHARVDRVAAADH